MVHVPVADPGGGRIGRGPPLFRPFFFLFTPEVRRVGGRYRPPSHKVKCRAHKNQGKGGGGEMCRSLAQTFVLCAVYGKVTLLNFPALLHGSRSRGGSGRGGGGRIGRGPPLFRPFFFFSLQRSVG